jgi:hypothetical protein
LTGKTLTATFTITGTATAFTYFGESQPGYDCGLPASVRLYFEGNHHRPLHVRKAMVVEPAGVHPDEPGRQYPHVDGSARHGELDQQGLPARFGSTDFAAAVATVGAVGVSFGGGCFLPTGAVPTDGTASFVLKSYSVS